MISTITVSDITPVPKKIMCTEVNSAMGLQVTSANKRKHDITFEGKDVNTYTTSPPPIKACKWSINNNNYMEAIEDAKNIFVETNNQESEEEEQQQNDLNTKMDNDKQTTITTKTSPLTTNKSCNNITTNKNSVATKTTTVSSNKCEKNNTKENCLKNTNKKLNCFTTLISITTATSTVSETITTTTTRTSSNTPLPPTSSSPVPEDSIAKLEVVASAPLAEPWTSTSITVEPVDCISKLQAVAVPTDPWGSGGSTRSTLATTLLNSDELDDDDDDFEDDYEEDDGLIPTYCSLRYYPFSSTSNTTTLTRSSGGYVPSSSYCVTRPNYYSEPFPQQNCARTTNNNSPHMRLLTAPTGSNSNFQWPNINQYYIMPETAYSVQTQDQQAPQQQQTIRCAENGKSYLELGCSNSINTSPNNTPPSAQILHHHQGVISSVPHCGFMPMTAAQHNGLKRCCEARSGFWCAATTMSNKSCYKDIRLKIRNLSMFKLSRFRQVSEQSLYRSVLICNTLKRIDREIEAEAKEMHNAAAASAVHHHNGTYNHNNNSSTTTNHQIPVHLATTANLHIQHHVQHQQQQQQQLPQQQNQDYTPVLNCARVSNVDYPISHYQQQQQQQQQQLFSGQNGSCSDNLGTATSTSTVGFFNASMHHKSTQILTTTTNNDNNNNNNNNKNNDISNNNKSNNTISSNNNSNCDTTISTTTSSNLMRQYDHYPFRDIPSGRATPYPCQFLAVTTTTAAAAATATPISAESSILSAPSTVSPTSTVQSSVTCVVSNSSSSALPITTSADSNNHQNVATTPTEFVEESDTIRSNSINWSSVLSLSSQSALDPLNNNDIFAILPPTTNPAVAVKVSVSSSSLPSTLSTPSTSSVTITSVRSSNALTLLNSNTTATFTTLSTKSSTTHLTSSYVNSLGSTSSNARWEYGFLDMEFGLGTEFTELMPPSCKMSSDDLFKNALTPVSTSRYPSVHENELEQPAHIMVGS